MKKRFLLVVLFLVAAVAARAQSETYLRYSQNPNLDVAFVEGFRIDSTTTVDVTVIFANESATMVWLMGEFGFTEADYGLLAKNRNAFSSKKFDRGSASLGNTGGKQVVDYAIASVYHSRICVYHITDNHQLRAIVSAELSKLNKK